MMTLYEEAIADWRERCVREGCRSSLQTADVPSGFRRPGQSLDSYVDGRHEFVRKFSFSIPTAAVIKKLARVVGPIVEVGAGTGYWAYELCEAGADIVATDLMTFGQDIYDFRESYFEVEQLDALAAAQQYSARSLLVSWPDDFNAAFGWSDEMLEAYEKAGDRQVIYIGEGNGGCTGSDRFHALLRHRWHEVLRLALPRWDGIHDAVTVHELGSTQQKDWSELERKNLTDEDE